MGKRIFLIIISIMTMACWSQQNILTNNVYDIKIFQASSSGKSIIVERGKLEGLTIGETAHIFYRDSKSTVTNPKYEYVAEGEVVKLKDSQSYWYLKKIRRHYHIRTGKNLAFIMKGRDPRRPFNTRHVHRLAPGDQSLIDFKNQGEMPDDLVFGDEQYYVQDSLIDTKVVSNDDIVTNQVQKWDKFGGEEYDKRLGSSRVVLRSPPIVESEKVELIKKQLDKSVFDSTAIWSMSKVNAQKYGLEQLYSDAIVEKGTGVRAKTNTPGLYAQYKEKEKEENLISPGATHMIREGGALFSRGMTDKELRKFFIDSGIERELARQKKALEQSLDHEFQLTYSNNMTNHSTTEDASYQGSNYALTLAYELYLQRTMDRLRNYTLSAEFERGVGNYDINNINGRFSYGSFNVYIHYYFLNPPISLKRYMPFLGIGYRNGNADVFSPNLTKDYEYEFNVIPSLRFGVKYRFKEGDTDAEFVKLGMGLSLLAQYDSISFTNTSFIEDDVFSSFSTNELKVGIGLNMYF